MSKEPEKEPEDKQQAIPGVELALTPEQIAMAARHVSIDYRGNLHYTNTLIERIGSQDAHTVMMGLHVTICNQLMEEYRREDSLSKNSHRRLTQVIFLYRMDITTQLKLDVDEAIEQAALLDRYSEKISKEFRAARTEGNVKTVEEYPDSIKKRLAKSPVQS